MNNRKIEDDEKRNLKKDLKNQERIKFLSSLPVSISILHELFDYVDVQILSSYCDHSLKFTREFIKEKKISENELIEWLRVAGGYCDCEVLANIEEKINEY